MNKLPIEERFWNETMEILRGEYTMKEMAHRILDLHKSQLSLQQKELREKLMKYACDFNWDFEKNKPKHKSYIALDTVLALIEDKP